jgi:hypothetical protein
MWGTGSKPLALVAGRALSILHGSHPSRLNAPRSAFQLRSGCLRMLPQEILQFPSADSRGADESFYAGFSRVLRDGVLAQKSAHHLSAGRPGAVRFRSPGSSVDSLQSFQRFVNTLSHAASFGGFRAIPLKLRLPP